MKRWLESQLDEVRTALESVRIILDPDGLLDVGSLGEGVEVEMARDWYALRRAYEQRGRRRPPSDPPMVIVLRSERFSRPEDLPFDIEQTASVVRVRAPAPAELRPLVRELPDELSDRAVEVLSRAPADPTAELLEQLWGVALPTPSDEALELEAVARLRARGDVPGAAWELLRPRLRGPLAVALAADPPDPGPLQDAWEEWLRDGSTSQRDRLFRRIGPSLGALFISGLLEPRPAAAADLPGWARIGTAEVAPEERVVELLAQRPVPWPPTRFDEWAIAAAWWGEVRATLGACENPGEALAGRVWSTWDELDAAFCPWLRSNYGPLLSRTSSPPSTVHKTVPFLARRLREGAQGILLVVLDGMGFPQWSVLRRAWGLSVTTSGASAAMLPPLTEVSRQAIFAAGLPSTFAASIETTSKEPERWREAWEAEGVDVGAVRYMRTAGTSPSDVPALAGAKVVGVVVTAIDDMLHGAQVFGDRQVLVQVDAWARRGFLRALVEAGVESGFEVWFTADHGNIEAHALGRMAEGLRVEDAGTRVRRYRSEGLRSGSGLEGIEWDPPGLPAGYGNLLFAPGRGGYFSDPVRVTHGGLSLDEVLVPFVQVTV